MAIGWVSAIGGHSTAVALDASIAGAGGLVAAACFVVTPFASPRYGLVARRPHSSRARRSVARRLAAEGVE